MMTKTIQLEHYTDLARSKRRLDQSEGLPRSVNVNELDPFGVVVAIHRVGKHEIKERHCSDGIEFLIGNAICDSLDEALLLSVLANNSTEDVSEAVHWIKNLVKWE